MDDAYHVSPEQLLEYQLGLLDPETARLIEARLREAPDLAEQNRHLSAWLRLLDRYETPSPPPELAARIVARVGQTAPLRVTEAGSSLPPSSGRGPFRRPVVSLRELVALAACITFFIGVVIPGLSRHRSAKRQLMCAGQLSQVYRGVSQYAAIFNGHLPQTAGFVPGVSWWRRSAATEPQVPNSRNRYLLIRLRLVRPRDFVCPARPGARPMADERIDELDDFPVPEACSFDSQNMAGPTLPLDAVPGMPIFADRNPLFDGDPPVSASVEANSRSHDGGRGQNVLRADGVVTWTSSPIMGRRGDNIWQVEGVTTYSGTEYQRDPGDVFLIP
jgi:hypothetical protein